MGLFTEGIHDTDKYNQKFIRMEVFNKSNRLGVFALVLCFSLIVSNKISAAITQVGTAQTASAANVQSFNITKPTGVKIGDLLVINVVKSCTGNTSDPFINGNGWTVISGPLNSAGDIRAAVMYKIVDNNEYYQNSVTVVPESGWWPNVDYAQATLTVYTGVDSSNPFDVTPGAITTRGNSNNSTITLPGITTVTPDAMILMLGMSMRNGNSTPRSFSTWSLNSPTVTENYDSRTSGNYVAVGGASGTKTTAGSTGNGTITLNNSAYLGGIILALRPLPPLDFTTTTTETCIGGSTGTISVSATGGVSPYTYSNGGNYQSPSDFSGLAAGNYTVTIKDALGNTTSKSVTVSSPSASTDDQSAAGTDSWIGHVYDGVSFTTYYGHSTEAETFYENFGGNATCYPIISNSVSRSIYTETFSVKYRMNSSKKGLYVVDMGSDDGNRLTVDGAMIYSDWTDHAIHNNYRVLMNLTGTSNLLYEFYENGGDNITYFQNLTLVLANVLSTNTDQTLYLGGTGAAISGDVFGTLPNGISLSGTGYQWYYSTTPSGTKTAISGATAATFTPNTSIAPFTTAGTYYLFRVATLSSSNNTSYSPYVASNESNAAVVRINLNNTTTATVTNSSCPLVADGSISLTQPIDYAVEFHHASKDYIDLGSKMLTNRNAFTLEGWIKYKSSDITGSRFGSLFGQNDVIEFGIFDATNIQCWTASTGGFNLALTTTLGDDKWHHIAAVGNSTSITIYVDGVSQGVQTFGSITSFGNDANYNTCIGGGVWDGYAATNSQTFPGQMRRVGIWSRALSAAEVASLATYTHVYTGSETGLIAGYNFSEGTGLSLSRVPSGLAGGFGNSPAWVDLLNYSWTKSGTPSFNKTTRNITGLLSGNYTVVASNSYLTGSATFTVNSDNTCANYWVGSVDNDWSKAANWSAQYVPNDLANIEFATAANNGGTAAQRELKLDQNHVIGKLINYSNQRILIPANISLTVNDSILTDDVTGSKIYIQSGSTLANGSLIYHNSQAKPVYGTVEMYTKACYDPTGTTFNGIAYHYTWEFFGIPLRTVTANPTFAGSYVREYDETKTEQYGKWVQLTNSSVLNSFKGYEITQLNAKTIVFKGQLENSDKTISLPTTAGAYDAGQHILSNPYAAGIDIRKINFGANTDQTVYLYNTGSFGQWGSASGASGIFNSAPGQYLSIPQNLAGSESAIPYDIPSMQGFLIKTQNGGTGSITIPYSAAITKNVSQQRAKKESSESSSDKLYMKINVNSETSTDCMWLFEEPGTSHGYDNGWDGLKISPSYGSTQIFAQEESGDYQINSAENINDTYIGFQAGNDIQYSLTFTNNNIQNKYEGVYLIDLVENKVIDITQSGTTYDFVAESTPDPVKRFKIVTDLYIKDESDLNKPLKVFNSDRTVYINNSTDEDGVMYVSDIAGHAIKSCSFTSHNITTVNIDGLTGAYILNAVTGSERVAKRIIVK